MRLLRFDYSKISIIFNVLYITALLLLPSSHIIADNKIIQKGWPVPGTILFARNFACQISPNRAFIRTGPNSSVQISYRTVKRSQSRPTFVSVKMRRLIKRFERRLLTCFNKTQAVAPSPTVPSAIITVIPSATRIPTGTIIPIATSFPSANTPSPSPLATTLPLQATPGSIPRSPTAPKVMLFNPFNIALNSRAGMPRTFFGYENAALPRSDGLPIPAANNLTQPTRLIYLIATETTEDDIAGQSHIKVSDLNYDEFAFQHSTNPASLNIVQTAAGINVYWRYDQRNAEVISYRISKLERSGPDPYFSSIQSNSSLGRIYWWENAAWQVLDVISAQTQHEGFYSYADPIPLENYSSDIQICYKVDSILSNGDIRSYSFPVCQNLTHENPSLKYIKSAYARLLSSACPAQNSQGSLLLGTLCSSRPLECACRNSYEIKVAFEGEIAPSNVLIDLYHYINEPVSNGSMGAQRTGVLSSIASFSSPVPSSLNGIFTFNIQDLEQSVIFNRSWDHANPTENIIFRIRTNIDGIEAVFPRDGGYYVVNVNNRVRDRLWRGYNMIPDRSSWISAVTEKLREFAQSGYTGVMLDELRPFKGSKFNDWWGTDLLETPPIEYAHSYPSNSNSIRDIQDQNFNDPWTMHLVTMLSSLRLSLSDINLGLAGNTIKSHSLSNQTRFSTLMKPAEDLIASHLKYPIFETCLVGWSRGVLSQAENDEWIRHITRLEQMQTLNPSAIPICLNTATPPNLVQEPWSSFSQLNPSVRIFNLASMLMIKDPINLIYGTLQIRPSIMPANYPSTRIDDFIEYQLDLGNALSERAQVDGTLCSRRYFERGIVVVNPHSTNDCSINLTTAMKAISIVPGASPRLQTCSTLACDPGVLSASRAIRAITVPPKNAAILLYEEVQIPSHSPRRSFAHINTDNLTDLLLYNENDSATHNLIFQAQGQTGSLTTVTPAEGELEGTESRKSFLGDFNGDGTTDLIIYNKSSGRSEVLLLETNGSLLSRNIISDPLSTVHWNANYWDLFVGDFNGDGISDLMLYNKPFGHVVSVSFDTSGLPVSYKEVSGPRSGWTANYWDLYANDFNGDRITDLLIYQKTSGAAMSVLFNRNGTPFAYHYISNPAAQSHWRANYWDIIRDDFTGDGITDLILYNKDSGDAVSVVFNSSGEPIIYNIISDSRSSRHWLPRYWDILKGDFNGDQITDLLLYNKQLQDAISVTFNTAGAPINYQSLSTINSSLDWLSIESDLITGDFNGDSTDDILAYNLSLGTGTIVGFSTIGIPVSYHNSITLIPREDLRDGWVVHTE